MTSGIPGSVWQPYEDTRIRLARWKRLASIGTPVNDIAAAIGISRHALNQMVCRARRNGHPDAIRHPNAGSTGLAHIYQSRSRRARVRALRSKQGASS